MPSRHNEKMYGGMGTDVFEDHYRVPLMQKISRLFSPNDLAEGAIRFHECEELAVFFDESRELTPLP